MSSDALGDLLAKLTAARELLVDPAITGVRLVLTPERMVIAEARRLFTALSLHGFCVEAVTVNRVLPAASGARAASSRSGERQRWHMPLSRSRSRACRSAACPAEARRTDWAATTSEDGQDMFDRVDPMAGRVPASDRLRS